MGCLKEKLKLLLFFKAVGMYSNSITLLSLVTGNALKMYLLVFVILQIWSARLLFHDRSGVLK